MLAKMPSRLWAAPYSADRLDTGVWRAPDAAQEPYMGFGYEYIRTDLLDAAMEQHSGPILLAYMLVAASGMVTGLVIGLLL